MEESKEFTFEVECLELAAGQKLHEEQEHDNTVVKYAVKVVKTAKQSAIYLTYMYTHKNSW